MTATTAITATQPEKKETYSANKQRGGNDRRTQQSKQPTVNSSQSSVATSTRIEQKQHQESELRRKSKS